jgi:Ca2+:H+ antiporter
MPSLLPYFNSRRRIPVASMASPSRNSLDPLLASHDSSSPPSNGHTNDVSLSDREHGSSLLVKVPLYIYHATKTTMYSSKANLLLFLVPLAIVAANYGWNSVAVFTLSFLAIFPLAELLSWSTEQLAASTGQIIGGLLNATFGNAVEMIVGHAYSYRCVYYLDCICL